MCAILACIAGGIPACLAAEGPAPGGACSRVGACPGGGVCSRGGACWGGGVPAPGDVETPRQQTATVADGTHPTGMHSRSKYFSQKKITLLINCSP